jgi:hypothetical protein
MRIFDYARMLIVYSDALQAGWEGWSWDTAVNLQQTTQVHSGACAISVAANPWGTLSLHQNAGY